MANILVISPLASHPPQNGARRRIHGMLSTLKKRGHRIHYVYTACEKTDLDQAKRLMEGDWDTVDVFPSGYEFEKTQGEDYGLDDWINPDLLKALPDLVKQYEITHCLTNYVFQSKYFEAIPDGIPKILDTHDKLSRRALFEEMGTTPGFYYTTEEEEQRGLARADVVLAIQDNEVDYFQQSGKPVIVVGHLSPVAFLEKRYTTFKKIGYIGAFNKFNINALEQFIPAFADYVERTGADLTLSISGNAARHFATLDDFSYQCVQYEGFVASIPDYLESLDLYLNPTFNGTGLKIKSVEALSHGVPVVSTSVGWDGLQGLAGFHDAKTPEDLLEAIDTIQRHGFDQLTKLSNFSKATYSEYQMNLESNLGYLFESSGEGLLEWAGKHPRFIGNRKEENPDFLTLEAMADQDITERQARPRIAHLVNPVRMPKTSDLYIAQPMAFRAMADARDVTKHADVTLVGRRFPEDEGYLNSCFDMNLTLDRSAQDLGTIPGARKLPILSEVFSLKDLPEDITHIVYTNSDIGVQRHFYDFVAERIGEGYDALVINRRTLPKKFSRSSELGDIYADMGKDHPGFDCFVVSREVLEQCDFADTLVGVHLIGRVIYWNIIARAQNIGYFPARQLTFHIGDDVPSKGRSSLPYIKHNMKQGSRVVSGLRDNPGQFYDSERLERFDRMLQPSPGEIQGKFDPDTEPHNRLFLHAFFRSGSTYLYQKMRRQKGWTCYYEPFHEDLARFSPEALDKFKKIHDNSAFRHAKSEKGGKSSWLFAEFEPLLKKGVEGVEGFDRRLSYMHDFPGAKAAISRYIDGLTDASTQENIFFQFNRTALRQDLLKELYPDDTHIFLERPLRDIWGSFLSFQNKGVMGFLRNNLANLCFNADDPLMQALGEHVPLTKAPFFYFFHTRFSDAFHHFTLEQHFLIHAVFWYSAHIQAARSADYVIDISRIAKDRLLRLEAETVLASKGMNFSFSDVRYKRYEDKALLLSPTRMDQLEAQARLIAQSVYGDVALPEDSMSGGTVLPVPQSFETQTNELKYVFDQAKSDERQGHLIRLQECRTQGLKEQPEAPVLRANQAYGVRSMERSGALFYGFHECEKHHVWCAGHYCILRFAVETPGDLDVTLNMHVHPDMAHRGQGGVVLLMEERLEDLPPVAQMQPYKISVPAETLAENDGLVEISVLLPRIVRGRWRQLSLCLGKTILSQADTKTQNKTPYEEGADAPITKKAVV